MPVIEINNLTKDYGHGRGVFDVTFQVEKGEVFGFLGPNGAGKTTTIRHIMGFTKPEKGVVKVNGLNTWKHANEIQQTLGYLPGEIALPENLSGIQFIEMIAELRQIKDKTYMKQLLERFDLDLSGLIKRMSLGMKRKLAIVIAFMHDPLVLVLDEPTSGLDPIMRDNFIEFIKEEKQRGKTVLLSSHIFKEVEATCDKISIIKDGRIIENFSAEQLEKRTIKTYELALENEDQFASLEKEITTKQGVRVDEVNPEKKQLIVEVDHSVINDFISILAKYDLRYFTEIPFSLERLFLNYYDRSSKKGGVKIGND